MKKLDAALPPIWSHANPADISGDADEERYAVALEHLLDDDANDAVLVMNVPTALASPLAAAKSVIAGTERHRKERQPGEAGFRGVDRRQRSRRQKHSTPRKFRATRPNPTPSAASCIWCGTGNRASS